MKLINTMIGTAILSALATALLGTSSALATSTTLCKVHQEPCQAPNKPAEVHLLSVGEPTLLSSVVNILCLSALAKGTVLGLAAPQQVHYTALIWTGCRMKGSETHNCTVTTVALPLEQILRTGLNSATTVLLGLRTRWVCAGVMDCTFGGAGTEIGPIAATGADASSNGMFTANELSMPKEAGGFLCPNASKLHALYEPLEDLYIVS